MTRPVTGVGKPSSVARSPSSVDCSPAPSMRIPMPSSSGQVAMSGLTGTGLKVRLAGTPHIITAGAMIACDACSGDHRRGQGIGQAVAIELAAQGYTPALNDLKDVA